MSPRARLDKTRLERFQQQKKKIIQEAFPLKEAYAFAAAHGLEAQAQAIRVNPFKYNSKGLKDRSTTIRSAYMIVLFQSKGLFEEFQKEYWPFYETEMGKRWFRGYHKFVMLTSVLDPAKHLHY